MVNPGQRISEGWTNHERRMDAGMTQARRRQTIKLIENQQIINWENLLKINCEDIILKQNERSRPFETAS